ncbi:hypothetical protein J437_LFUL010834 [Ladona fulva]|uniref:Chitinase II/V-like catalytic domain-containing protein n=1 Tax=Ladona fulva TaxID=123851 RepID=A0A8K0K9E9_LADFU|nr:hypothetical protein J437_LFUL010834 [Ladona fulva]
MIGKKCLLSLAVISAFFLCAKESYSSSFLSAYKKKYPHIKLILGIDPFDLRPSGFPKYVRETAQVVSGIRKAIGRDGATISGYFVRNVTSDDLHNADLAEIAKDLDFMTMECYEPIKSRPYTQLVAPLYSKRGNSVSGCIKRYLDMGAPRSKVLMAIQNYAVSHTLDDADRTEPGSPAKNSGWVQYPSNRNGLLYLDQVTGSDWESYRDEKSNSPYSVNYLQWASYDDKTSVSDKAKFIKEKGLGGAALTTYPGIDKTNSDLPFAKYVAELLSS